MAFTNEQKDLDFERPFHRINSPWFKDRGAKGKLVTLSTQQRAFIVGPNTAGDLSALAQGAPVISPDGRGYGCGCRSVDDIPDMGFGGNVKIALLRFVGAVSGLGDPREVMHTLPGWVPVLNRNPMAPQPLDDVNNPTQVECEGKLVRSFQTWTDAPGSQWHEWYDWNFLLVPEPDGGYDYLRGAANEPPVIEDAGFTALLEDRVMELEWDCGAISASRPGPMFDTGLLVKPDGSRDPNDDRWFWPMRSHHIWGAGRWIYDCGHSNPPDNKTTGRMRTEIHPLKAMASARWEAVKFDENTHFVPAIQFMFFAHRRTGYKTWRTINDVDYEFLVDLPPALDQQPLEWSIGHTFQFPRNTGVLRIPRLLKKVRFMEMGNLQTPGPRIMPIVEEHRAEGDLPNAAPKQVKVTVPCTSLPASADYFGFVLSLGWHDPNRELARKVKKVTVFLDSFKVGRRVHDSGFTGPTAEWQLRVGVNGRWMQTVVYEGVKPNQTKTIQVDAGRQFAEFHLADTDAVIINAHGEEFDRVGDFMLERSVQQRTLRKGGRDADWEADIVVKDSNQSVLKDTVNAVADLMSSTLGIQNDPLGMIDPGTGPNNEKQNNPLTMKFVNEQMGGGIEDMKVKLTAFFTKEVGKLAELAEKRGTMDYELNFTLNVAPQRVD